MSEKPIILVVDDDAPILLLMKNVLREFGFDPLTAITGSEAMSAMSAKRPDLVLLDKNMPGMTGAEVIRAIRADREMAGTPVLILSGEPVNPAEIAALGADGAVQKPFDIHDLVGKIRTALQHRAEV